MPADTVKASFVPKTGNGNVYFVDGFENGQYYSETGGVKTYYPYDSKNIYSMRTTAGSVMFVQGYEDGHYYSVSGGVKTYYNEDGTVYVSTTIYWGIDSDTNGTLTLSNSALTPSESAYQSGSFNKSDRWTSTSSNPWYSYRTSISTVNVKSKIQPRATSYWFYGCSNLTTLNNMSNIYHNDITYIDYMFYDCSSLTDVVLDWSYKSGESNSQISTLKYMFGRCTNMTSVRFPDDKLPANRVNMYGVFYLCTSLTGVRWFSGVIIPLTAQGLFYGCTSLTDWNVDNRMVIGGFSTQSSSDKTSSSQMFQNCTGLTSLDLSTFRTSGLTVITQMFYGCSNLAHIYVSSSWSVSSITTTNSANMFYGCTRLPNFNSSYVNKTKAHYNSGGYLELKS